MSGIDRFSVVTLVFFFLSTIFVIHPFSFYIRLPYVGRTRCTIGLTTAPILAIAILWAAQCIGASQIRDGIVGTDGIKPYNILILFISLAYMAITLDVTGILQAAAFWVSNKGGSNGRKLYFYFYVLLTVISMVLGNDPVILSGTAFLVYYTAATGLDPLAWLISEFAAANTASMVLFVGNPTNVVICEGFRINNAAFTAYTILPFIACSVCCYLALAVQFRDPKHVPRRLNVAGTLNVREVLRDPVSAVFGSVLLGVCLVVIIVLSFFHIDVWIIVLPFAVAKFVFDLCWDHYRYQTNRIPRYEGAKRKRTKSFTAAEDLMVNEIKRAMSLPANGGPAAQPSTFTSLESDAGLVVNATSHTARIMMRSPSPDSSLGSRSSSKTAKNNPLFAAQRAKLAMRHERLAAHFPTFFTALPRLPFGLIPFAFSQFILIEGLTHQGWIDVFAHWLVVASKREMIPTVWVVGVVGVVLCNVAGTNIGATILLTKTVRAAPDFPVGSAKAAALALAVASNIGAVSFTYSASLAGLLWQSILSQKGIHIKQRNFAFWNGLPLLAMTGIGLAVVTAQMIVLY